MKLSDLKDDDIELHEEPKSSGGLKLSDLHSDDISLDSAEDPNHISLLQSAGKGLQQGTTLGFADELGGLAGALGSMSGGDERAFSELYKEARDANRQEYAEAQHANPKTYGLSELAGGFLVPVPGAGAGASTAARVAGGIGLGTAAGAGYSNKEDLSGIALDAGLGGVLGGGVAGVAPHVTKMVGENPLMAAAGGAAGYAMSPDGAEIPMALLGAAGGAGLGKLGTGTYNRFLSKIPMIEEPIQQFRVNASGADTLTESGRGQIQDSAIKSISEPAQAAQTIIREGTLDPANQRMADLSKHLAEKINAGLATEQDEIVAKQLMAAQSTMEQIARLGGEAGEAVGAIKNHIAQSPDTTKAVQEGLEALQGFVQNNATLRNNPTAQQIVQEYGSWTGGKAQATGQELVDVMGGLSDMSQRADIRDTQLGKGVNQARAIVEKTGKQELLSPEQMVQDQGARSQYTAFKQLADNYGIDPKNLSSEALLKKVQEIAQIPETGARAAASKQFLGLIDQLSPKLRENLEKNLVQLEQQRSALPNQVNPTQVANVLGEVAPKAVEKGNAPASIIRREEFMNTAKRYMPEEEVSQTINEAVNLGNVREEAMADMKNLDVNNLLNALQNSMGDNISPRYKLERFYKTIEKADPKLAETLRTRHMKELDGLEASQNLGGSRNEFVGIARNVINTVGANAGQAYNKGVKFLTGASPDMYKDLAQKAQGAGHTRLGQYLSKAGSLDPVGRSATLYLISQDSDMQKQLEDISK